MPNNALYFPYIDLPRNRFTNTALLYWDKILTIAPYGTEYVLQPENQNDLLIRNGAIIQLHPEQYSNSYADFGTNFIKLIDSVHLEWIYPARGGWAALPEAAGERIHTEKLLTYSLCEMSILNGLFPVMDDLLSAEQILELRSKDKDQKMRLNFRAGIERFINKELAFITDPRERRAQINGFIIRKREEIREIEKELEEFSKKWPTRIGFASLGFVTAGIAAFDLLHGGVFSTASEAALGISGFGGSVIYAARGAVKDLREGAPELEKEMAFAAWVGPASRRRSLWHRIARRLHLH